MSARLADPSLMLAADVVDDLERVRIANENRLRQPTRAEVDSDGEGAVRPVRRPPDVARPPGIVEAMAKLEHDATLGLQRHAPPRSALRRPPRASRINKPPGSLPPWVTQNKHLPTPGPLSELW